MTIFERLNPSSQAHVVASIDGFFVEEDETNMFSVGASMEKYSWALVIGELSLFQSLAIPPLMCVCKSTGFDGRPTKVKFQMLASLPNKFLRFWGFKLRLKECST